MKTLTKLASNIGLAIMGSCIGLVLLQTPLLGVILFLPFIPLVEVYDAIIPGEFLSTGQHVEVGFAWITFKTWQAWLFYGSFFFLFGLLALIIRYLTRGNVFLFVGSLLLLLVISTSLMQSVRQHQYQEEALIATTATETVFRCDAFVALYINENDTISRYKYSVNTQGRTVEAVGKLDRDTNTLYVDKIGSVENEYTIKSNQERMLEIESCRNSNGLTMNDMFTVQYTDY